MTISIYLILLIVLLVFNLIFWILVIWFRILVDCDFGKCCGSRSADETETPSGHRNLGFDDNEDLYNTRPNTITERMESPPSYEEALKYDQFGFYVSPPVHTSSPSSSSPSSTQRSDVPYQHLQVLPQETTPQHSQSPPPSHVADVRARSSATGNNSLLSPIREEEIDDMPVTVVIDCIGVQASKLMENCDHKVDISGGENLNGQSKC